MNLKKSGKLTVLKDHDRPIEPKEQEKKKKKNCVVDDEEW